MLQLSPWWVQAVTPCLAGRSALRSITFMSEWPQIETSALELFPSLKSLACQIRFTLAELKFMGSNPRQMPKWGHFSQTLWWLEERNKWRIYLEVSWAEGEKESIRKKGPEKLARAGFPCDLSVHTFVCVSLSFFRYATCKMRTEGPRKTPSCFHLPDMQRVPDALLWRRIPNTSPTLFR